MTTDKTAAARPQLELVQHPAGGMTLAVPVGGSSTVRIYQGVYGRPLKKFPRRARR